MYKIELLIFNPFLKTDPTLAFLIPINGTIHPILHKKDLEVMLLPHYTSDFSIFFHCHSVAGSAIPPLN